MKITLTFILALIVSITVSSQPGTLDQSFGLDGKVLENFATLSPNYYKGLVTAEDKIIEIGSGNGSFGAVRYTADGSLDNNFGDSGFAVVDLSFEATAWAYSVAQQSSGKYILTGVGIHGFPDDIYDGLIVRLNDDGSLDPTFGVDGVIKRTSRKGSTGSFGSIAILPDNSFIVQGVSNGVSSINRFTEDGVLDQSFGQSGYVYLDNNFNVATCRIQVDGKIVLAGSYYFGGIPRFSLQRFLPDGSIDETFGNNGTVTTTNGLTGDILADMGFQSDGKIVVTGTESYSFMVSSRYTADGRLDSTFGINGRSSVKLSNMSLNAWGIVVTGNDEIIVGGTTESTDLFSDNYAIVKLTQNGIVDSSFGDSGQTITDFGDGFGDQILSIGMQQSGKIIAIGKSTSHDAFYSSLARYNNDESKKQIIITKIKHWIQHHNGIEWDYTPGVKTYAVQKSVNGATWSTVYHASSSNDTHYSDPAPSTSNTTYYRLQTTRVDGAVANSNVIAISNDAIKISPNPAQNILHVEGLPSNQKIKITVVDFNGNVAISQQLLANSNTYNLNIASLKQGNYLLRIETNDDVVTKKFVKE